MNSRTSLRPLPGLMSVVLLVTLVGCSSTAGGSSATSPGPTSAGTTTQASGPVDACELVTSADAQAALGKPVRPAKAESLPQGANCTYESTDFANGTADGASLVITYFPKIQMSRGEYDEAWRSNGFQEVSGLGESAWFLGGTLNIYDHGATVSVSIVSLQTEATVDELSPVALLALGRI